MLDKYLPIGTVCSLRNQSSKFLIVGYNSKGRNDSYTYDYSAFIYPYGLSISKKTYLFNHEQITKVYHLGYVTQESDNFIIDLSLKKTIESDENNLSSYVFDENGVLISDGINNIADEQILNDSKYKFDENGILISDGVNNIADKQISNNSKYKFDENGILISDGINNITEKPISNSSEYQFDENGILISDGITSLKQQEFINPFE